MENSSNSVPPPSQSDDSHPHSVILLDYGHTPARWRWWLGLVLRVLNPWRVLLRSWIVLAVLAQAILLVQEFRGLRPWQNPHTVFIWCVGWWLWIDVLKEIKNRLAKQLVPRLFSRIIVAGILVFPLSTMLLFDPCPHGKNLLLVIGPIGIEFFGDCSNSRDWTSIWGWMFGVHGITNWG